MNGSPRICFLLVIRKALSEYNTSNNLFDRRFGVDMFARGSKQTSHHGN